MSISDERREKSQETIDNTIAIGKLIAVQERTTDDVDKLVRHIEKFLPVHSKLANLRTILFGVIFVALGFGTWITLDHFRLSGELATHIAVQAEHELTKNAEQNAMVKDILQEVKKNHIYLLEKVSKSETQITYLKGRIKK